MKSWFLIPCLVLILGSGCPLPNEPEGYRIRPLSTWDIEVSDLWEHGVSFVFHSGIPDPCYEFWMADIDREGAEVFVTVHARRPSSALCPAIAREVHWPLDIEVAASGAYEFRFWRDDSTTVDTTIAVP